ncbi:ChrB protein, partial [bacterium]|nr:ChrB protein [bacterium]
MKWLFLVHQVLTPNSKERVKVWRAIKKTGAVLYRNSVYILPYSKERLEDFQWVCQQINDSRGEASIFISSAENKKED